MTTTVRSLISSEIPGERPYDRALTICEKVGLDPDTPPEWATVDRCLTWLRERSYRPSQPVWRSATADYEIRIWDGSAAGLRFVAPTLHAALVAACQAVQDG